MPQGGSPIGEEGADAEEVQQELVNEFVHFVWHVFNHFVGAGVHWTHVEETYEGAHAIDEQARFEIVPAKLSELLVATFAQVVDLCH